MPPSSTDVLISQTIMVPAAKASPAPTADRRRSWLVAFCVAPFQDIDDRAAHVSAARQAEDNGTRVVKSSGNGRRR